jgi:hypothetical protein
MDVCRCSREGVCLLIIDVWEGFLVRGWIGIRGRGAFLEGDG